MTLTFGHLRVVLFTKQSAVDEPISVPRLERMSACDTDETLDVIDAALGSVDQLTSRDVLTTAHARPAAPKQPNVVVPTQYHASLGKAGLADLAQLCLTTGTLQTACVPVPVQGV